MSETPENPAESRMAERIRPLVNEILERFNQEQIAPAEAGMVILALTHRLLGILSGAQEARNQFIMSLIDLINSYLSVAGEGMGEMI